MRVDFDQVIENFSGTPLRINNEIATLKVVATAALMATYSDEPQITGPDKASRYELASAIHAGSAGPTTEEIALIKTLVGKAFPPTIVGPAFRMLDAAQFDDQLKGVMSERSEAGLDEVPKQGSA